MVILSDEEVVKGLLEKRADCIRYLYREFFPLAKSFVAKNSGTYEDAEDVFQDGLIVLYMKCKKGNLDLNCSMKTYFYSICRNIWLQRLDRKWRLSYRDNLVNDANENFPVQDMDIEEEKLERRRLYELHFLSLPGDCQRILKLFVNKVSLREIASLMGFKDAGYVKTRKYLCKNMLRKRILKDPKCQNLLNYD